MLHKGLNTKKIQDLAKTLQTSIDLLQDEVNGGHMTKEGDVSELPLIS
jgi:hypothetical protein